MASQWTKSLRDFLVHGCGALLKGGHLTPPSEPPLVVRVGAAGHLSDVESPALIESIHKVLKGLREFTFAGASADLPTSEAVAVTLQPEVRLISQLASGFDQLAAGVAQNQKYRLHAVLPGFRAAFAKDVENSVSPDMQEDTGQKFEKLLGECDRVLELDADVDGTFCLEDYARAGQVIIDHIDILLVGVHSDAKEALGGTVWLKMLALRKGLPVIHVPTNEPSAAVLEYVVAGEAIQTRIFDLTTGEIDARLFKEAFGGSLHHRTDAIPCDLGWFERRYAAQLNPAFNAALWSARWTPVAAEHGFASPLADARAAIDTDLAPMKIWADQLASAFAEMLRGSAVLSYLLAVVAIFAAAVGLLHPPLSLAGKLVEIASLSIVIWLALRSNAKQWRSHWLAIRQLERLLDQAAWSALWGRGSTQRIAQIFGGSEPGPVSLWTDASFAKAVRASSFPSVRLSPIYLASAWATLSSNLVRSQIDYFESEGEFQERSAKSLYVTMITLAGMSIFAALIYLTLNLVYGIPWLATALQFDSAELHHVVHEVGVVAAWLGILLPAVIAALAAIRNFGEYEQLGHRYKEIAEALTEIEQRPPPSLRSDALVGFSREVTSLLFQEVSGWRSIFRFKALEGV